MRVNPHDHPSPLRPREGSALLLTILTVSLLVMLTLGFVAMIRMETRAAANRQQDFSAEKNAGLALELAIAALQEHSGPDQRVTAPADLRIPAGVSVTPDVFNLTSGNLTTAGTSGAAARTLVDTYWSAQRNRRWVGAYRNGNTSGFDPANPPAYNALPQLQRWLVSGNESSPNTFDPAVQVTGLTAASSPRDAIRDANNRVHRLLVKRTAGVTATADLDRAVTAPELGLVQNGVAHGNIAWWVGDEGIKARANLIDAYAGESTASGHASNQARRQSAQRPVLEVLPDLQPYYPANDALLGRPVAPTQMGMLHADPAYRANLRDRYHDLSLVSRGVLANAKHGGLKGDLTHILSQRTTGDFRDALTAAFFGANVVPSANGNVALTPAASVFAAIPTQLTSSYTATYEAAANHFVRDVPVTVLEESSTWEQLWSHYNLGRGVGDSPAGAFASADGVRARLPTMERVGLTPLLLQGKIFYRLRNDGGRIVVDMNPLVVLANPYPFALRGDFILRFLLSPNIYYGDMGDMDNPTDAELNARITTLLSNALPANGGMGNILLVAKASGIPPGEAQIFTLDPDADLRVAHATTDTHEVAMIPSYDPSVFLSYESTRTVPAGTNVWVGLKTGNQMHMRAYMESVQTPNQFSFVFCQSSTAYTASTGLDTNLISSGASNLATFRVFPFPWADGEKRGGGGVTFTLHDGYNRTSPQQSPFLGINYRSMKVMYQGNSTYHHPLEWSISYGIRGSRDQPYDTLPLDYYDANILLPPGGSGIPNTTRWGLVNTGGLPSYNVPPPGIDPTGNTALVNVLYDLPQPGLPPVSLGQLQHFNLAGTPNASPGGGSPQSWQLNYPIANSYITPRVPRDLLFYNHSTLGSHYDGAWLWNEILWDRFYFSSFPTEGDFDFDRPTDRLVNARHQPFRDRGQVPRNDPVRYRGVFEPAKNLLVDGAFNINSTSVDAWKAVLAGLRGVPTGSETDANRLTAPFSRVLNPIGGAADAEKGNTPNAWNGFRNLNDAELQALAEEIVLQIRLRGPFLSLADFTNRQLTRGRHSRIAPAPADTYRLGLTGAIQAALDRVINRPEHIPNTSNGNGGTFRDKTAAWYTSNGNGPHFGDVEHRTPTRISGFPGFLLQGDVLSAIGPGLSARSDTFTIRTYGDTAQGGARAWCEAVVQRLPDFVDGANPPDAPPAALTPANLRFGRRYEIVSFRWLNEEDI